MSEPFDILPDTPDVRARDAMATRNLTPLVVAFAALYSPQGPSPTASPYQAIAKAVGTLMMRLADIGAAAMKGAIPDTHPAKLRGDMAIMIVRAAGWAIRHIDPTIKWRLMPTLISELRHCADCALTPSHPEAQTPGEPFQALATEACNLVLRAEGCFDLPAYHGGRFISTWWTPSAEALAALNAGVPLKLTLEAPRWPPSRLEVDAL